MFEAYLVCMKLQLPSSYWVGATITFKSDLLMLDVLLQLQHDYILGNYPVGRDDAAQLSALQILAKIGSVSTPESCT